MAYQEITTNYCSVIVHLDVDSFECQVHGPPELKGQPFIVANSAGIITSVSPEAKAEGVTRGLHRQQCQNRFPYIQVVEIPDHPKWNKPDTSKARLDSFRIRDAVVSFKNQNPGLLVVNKHSSDEYYIDATKLVDSRVSDLVNQNYKPYPNYNNLAPKTILEGHKKIYGPYLSGRLTHGYDRMERNDFQNFLDESRLFFGAEIAHEISERIYNRTGFEVSGGIGPNMLLAKLASPLNKPNGFTVLPLAGLDRVSHQINMVDIPGLGGKSGKYLASTFPRNPSMYDVSRLSVHDIQSSFDVHIGKLAVDIYNLTHGLFTQQVVDKTMDNEVTVSKTFRQPGLKDKAPYGRILTHIEHLGEEMMQRLKHEEYGFHGRKASTLKIEVNVLKKFAAARSTWSHTFEIDDQYEYLVFGEHLVSGSEIAQTAMSGLEEVGFRFDSSILKLKLTACRFDKVEFNVQKYVLKWLSDPNCAFEQSDDDDESYE